MELHSATAIVTGSGRGIGRAIAQEFAARGTKVALAARTGTDLEHVAAQIAAAGGTALPVVTDVTAPQSVEDLMHRAEDELGHIDILVNNAAIARCVGPLHQTDPDAWIEDIQVNLIGYYHCLRAALPSMLSRNRGCIINMIGGDSKPLPFLTSYNTAKTGVMRLTETLALELADTAINIFGMSPGFVHTGMTDYILESPDGRRWQGESTRQRLEQGLNVSPALAAAMAVELASGKLDTLTGRAIRADKDDPEELARNAEDIVKGGERVLRTVSFPE
ncbi:MAG: SDR family NAD(P)-dependent oxidoreductase [Candidatus Latescibacteria bacterium]|nr:SDR family NAD(P)-dependent oxidoreductase [Candidatus Latescibacterota bacterium]